MPGRLPPRALEAAVAALAIALTFVLYAGSLGGPFIFDDTNNIEHNAAVHMTELTPRNLLRAGLESPLPARFVANVSFALNYYVHGSQVIGYRVVNVCIHVATAILLYFLVVVTVRAPALAGRHAQPREVAFFTALLWLVHPIQTQSVAYVVQRMNSMSAMFYVLALLCYAHARLETRTWRRRILFGASVLSALLALGSKEIAATLPVFVLLYEWYFFQDLKPAWLRRHGRTLAALSILVVVVALAFLGAHPVERLLRAYAQREFTLPERLLTETRVVVLYLSLLFAPYPARLNLDYDFPLSRSLLDPPTTLLSILALAGLFGAAVGMARRQRLASFCILWFLGNLAIESSVLPLEIVFEHRTYLPSMGICLLAVTLVYRASKAPRVRVALLAAVAVLFSFWTIERSRVWGDDVRLWQDVVTKSPGKARGHFNLANQLVDHGNHDEAIEQYARAIEINPKHRQAYFNRGRARTATGDHSGAVSDYSQAIEITRELLAGGRKLKEAKLAEAHFNRGKARRATGDGEGALEDYGEAIEINPQYELAYNGRGGVRHALGDYGGAIADFTRAIELDRTYADAWYNRGRTKYAMGDLAGAEKDFTRAVELDPKHAKAYNNRGIVRFTRDDYGAAVADYTAALKLNPRYALAYYNRGVARQASGDGREGCADLRRSVELGYAAGSDALEKYCGTGKARP